MKHVLIEEKLDGVVYFLQNSLNKSLRCLGQEAGISKARTSRAMKLLKLCIMVIKIFFLVIVVIINNNNNK